jgi:hypothetical protein
MLQVIVPYIKGTGLRMFDSRVLRKIFGQRGYEVKGEWKKLQNEKPCDFYS